MIMHYVTSCTCLALWLYIRASSERQSIIPEYVVYFMMVAPNDASKSSGSVSAGAAADIGLLSARLSQSTSTFEEVALDTG